MSNITDWIKNELYPSLFESIDRALPELEFRKQGYKWISSLKLDLSKPKTPRADKTVVSSKAPGAILENGSTAISLVDYVMSRDNVSFIDAVKTLAQVVNLQLPKGDIDQNSYSSYKERANILEDCNSYFMYCLWNSPGAQDVRDYLSSRGYSSEDIKTMELGFIPSQEKLYTYLRKQKHKEELIDEIKLNKAIGEENKLSIPYRSSGSITGFIFRTIEPDQANKYMNSTGLERSKTLFNMKPAKGDKDIVIVEGFLDALIADARGVDNVVALGGVNLSKEQIQHAISKGAKKFTLCLDRDKAGAENTLKAIDLIVAEGISRVYVAILPEIPGTKTDPDSLIKELGVEALKDAIIEALPYYEYKLLTTLNKYGEIEQERGLQPKDIDNLLDEVVITATNIQNVIDRDRYRTLFTSLDQIKELGITEESLSITVDRLTTTRDKENQAKDFKKLLSEATTLQDKGETDKALELLDSKVKEVKSLGAKNLLPPPLTFSNLLEEIANIPPAYKTGYSSLDDFIGFTPGGVTLIAGRPGHGKTTFMFNLVLQMADLYPDESFYFFSYEEAVGNISIKLLNRLINTDLSEHFREVNISKPSNYEFIKHYIRNRRTDIPEIESGKRELQELMDSKRITVIGKNYSVEELSGLIPYLTKREKVGAIFIDYIQRMNTKRKTQDKRTEIAYISDQVLQIAKGTGLPLILGAQLNRDGKGKPTLENLKEAGNLEEDANTVISVYCEAREKEETDEGEDYSKMREVDLVIKVLKNREGEVNTKAVLTFDRYTTVIKDKQAGRPVVKKVTPLVPLEDKPKTKKQLLMDQATAIASDIRRLSKENLFTGLTPLTDSKIVAYCRTKNYDPDVITLILKELKSEIALAKIEQRGDKANE